MTIGGTIVCGVSGDRGATDALHVAAALGERLGMRLVVVRVAGAEGGARRGNGITAAEPLLDDAVDDPSVTARVERRVVGGEPAIGLAEVAAEEGADLIIIGTGGSPRRKAAVSRLAAELESATACPVLIAPPQTRRRSRRRLASAPVADLS